jgi:hypothetical protein
LRGREANDSTSCSDKGCAFLTSGPRGGRGRSARVGRRDWGKTPRPSRWVAAVRSRSAAFGLAEVNRASVVGELYIGRVVIKALELRIARLGVRTGASSASLLAPSDFPEDGWANLGGVSWRTGVRILRSSGSARRARRARTVSSMCWLQSEDKTRFVLAEVAPYASTSDATCELPNLQKRILPNPRAQVRVTEEREVEGLTVPGVDNPWTLERLTEGADRPTASRYIAGNVGRFVSFVGCVGYRDAWPWEEVISLATRQGLKVRERFDPGTPP